MFQHPPPLELSAPVAPIAPPSKPEPRPPPTALLDNSFWEDCLLGVECGSVAGLLQQHRREAEK